MNLQDSIHLKKNMKNNNNSNNNNNTTSRTSSSTSTSSTTSSSSTTIPPNNEINNETNNETNKKLISQHPLVGTLLWIMGVGKEKSIQVKQNNDSYDDKPSILSWKDHRGGQIAEFLSTQQVDGQGTLSSSSKAAPPPQLLSRNPRVLSESEIQKNAASPIDNESSPNWGFYVSITPETQVFSKDSIKK